MKKVLLITILLTIVAGSPIAQVQEKKPMKASETKIMVSTPKEQQYDNKRKILKTPLTDLDLSFSDQTYQELKDHQMNTISDLAKLEEKEVLVLGLSDKALGEIKNMFEEKGISFGTDIARYNLDED